ncbi:uncharacterized protein N7483_008028 [Penicillium malachiteum]|uniref:uncharacterized protein n=1 Tax=Penicillium malachiteum TaxID=1324776 RepID=UPI002548EA71|nr:uncharacterized protein N7483_008028 [Penicillium malachiteum]KAJ5726671.1 hypothetical protein N7483_008028 [Penicillium malachiteum]
MDRCPNSRHVYHWEHSPSAYEPRLQVNPQLEPPESRFVVSTAGSEGWQDGLSSATQSQNIHGSVIFDWRLYSSLHGGSAILLNFSMSAVPHIALIRKLSGAGDDFERVLPDMEELDAREDGSTHLGYLAGL